MPVSPVTSGAAADSVGAEPRDHGLFLHRAGQGEPLVSLHGLGESHVGWHPVIDTLAAHYDVIAVDLPGFGRSPCLPGNKTPWGHRLAAAVQQRLDDLGVDRYHVAGYSLGARIAFRLAQSGRVGAVVAIGPDGTGTPMERLHGYFHLMAARGVAVGLAPAAAVLSRAAVGRSVFFAGNRAMPWRLSPGDAEQLLTGFAEAPGFEPTNWGRHLRGGHRAAPHHRTGADPAGHRGPADLPGDPLPAGSSAGATPVGTGQPSRRAVRRPRHRDRSDCAVPAPLPAPALTWRRRLRHQHRAPLARPSRDDRARSRPLDPQEAEAPEQRGSVTRWAVCYTCTYCIPVRDSISVLRPSTWLVMPRHQSQQPTSVLYRNRGSA